MENKFKVGDYIITKWYVYPAKIISIDEEGIIVSLPRFMIYDNDDVAFLQCEIETNDIVDFSTKDAFLQAVKDSLIDYQNTVNQHLMKMQNLITLSEVFE
jgi:hypothetical protein